MKIRHVFSVADVASARQAMQAARQAGLADDDLSLIARADIELEEIPDKRKLASTDFMPAAIRGAATGGTAGFVAGHGVPTTRRDPGWRSLADPGRCGTGHVDRRAGGFHGRRPGTAQVRGRNRSRAHPAGGRRRRPCTVCCQCRHHRHRRTCPALRDALGDQLTGVRACTGCLGLVSCCTASAGLSGAVPRTWR